MRCSKCEKKVEENFGYCPFCGALIQSEKTTQKDEESLHNDNEELVPNYKTLNIAYFITLSFCVLIIIVSIITITKGSDDSLFMSGGTLLVLYYFIIVRKEIKRIINEEFSEKKILTGFLRFSGYMSIFNGAIILLTGFFMLYSTLFRGNNVFLDFLEGFGYLGYLFAVGISMIYFVFETMRVLRDVDNMEIEYVEQVSE